MNSSNMSDRILQIQVPGIIVTPTRKSKRLENDVAGKENILQSTPKKLETHKRLQDKTTEPRISSPLKKSVITNAITDFDEDVTPKKMNLRSNNETRKNSEGLFDMEQRQTPLRILGFESPRKTVDDTPRTRRTKRKYAINSQMERMEENCFDGEFSRNFIPVDEEESKLSYKANQIYTIDIIIVDLF